MKLLEEYVNAFVLGKSFAKKYVANRREICCKSEKNMLQIGEKSGGNPANAARREEGVGGNLNFGPNMRETTCQLVAASYPTFCRGKNFRRRCH